MSLRARARNLGVKNRVKKAPQKMRGLNFLVKTKTKVSKP